VSGRGRPEGPNPVTSAEASEHGAAFGLPPALARFRLEVREWATEVLRPRAAELEWATDPAARVAWDLLEEVSERGWRTFGLAREDGGAGADALAIAVLIEELSYGDMGFAVLVDQCIKVQRILAQLARGRARELFVERFVSDPRCVLAICFTEPETSSDYIIDGPDFRFRTAAEQRPDGSWVLNGFKRYISNGADAGIYCVFACTDPDQAAAAGTSAFLVLADDPGVEVVKVHEKMSQRGNNNGSIRFTDVVLPADRMLGQVHSGYAGSREILKESAITAGATTLGSAQAAYDMAVEHARDRVQGGRPLIEHANVKCRLAEMFCELEAARSLVYRAAWAVEHDPAYDYKLGSAAKVFAAEASMRVALSAAETFGALAIMYTDCPVNKCVRDCMSFLHSDGAQDSHRLRIGAMIAGEAGERREHPRYDPPLLA
jgi:alkylation response protein AidB-like acyl-CoA dehydrogenase